MALQLYYGGFTSPKIVDDFVKYVQQIALVSGLALTSLASYAKTVFQAYGDRVKTWFVYLLTLMVRP